MSDGEPLQLNRTGAIGTIVLARPDAGNAINLPMAEAFNRAAAQCDLDGSMKVVVLRGVGKLFCGGGDIRAFIEAGDRASALIQSITGNLHTGIARLVRMQKPLITAVNGSAGGAGLSLACIGDIAVAARSAKFSVGYTAIGLVPDGGLTWLLPRLIGLRRAQELILTNRRICAQEAADIGLVTRIVDDEVLDAEVAKLARQLASGPTLALGKARELILAGLTNSLETQMELESREICRLVATRDAIEGISAFAERRNPSFSGHDSSS